jgi:hypothetical protein
VTEDEVVREVRAARDAFAASHGYDIRAMVAALRQVGVASGRVVIPVTPRAARTPGQAAPQAGPARSPSGV